MNGLGLTGERPVSPKLLPDYVRQKRPYHQLI
jgi:hypothetical protein